MNEFNYTFESDMAKIRDVIKELISFIEQSSDISSEDLYDLKIAFSELLINAVKHGNKGDKSKYVELMVKFTSPNTLKAVIADEGEGFDHVSLCNELKKPYYEFSDLESGRGMQIVFGIVDDLSFNDSGNCLAFYKSLRLN